MRRFFFNAALNPNFALNSHSNSTSSLKALSTDIRYRDSETVDSSTVNLATLNNDTQVGGLNELAVGTELFLPDDVYHHWCRVLRAKVGEQSVIFDGLGGEAVVELESIDKKQAAAKIQSFIASDRTAANYTLIGMVMSRGDRMDYAIQKATELGVTVIQLLTSQHGEVRLKANQIDKKLNHWQQIALSACEQCGLNRPPLILSPLTIETWLTGQTGEVHDCVKYLTDNTFYQNCLSTQALKLVLAVPSLNETMTFDIQAAIQQHGNTHRSSASQILANRQTQTTESLLDNQNSTLQNSTLQNSTFQNSTFQKTSLKNTTNLNNCIQSDNLQPYEHKPRFDILIGPEGGLSQTEYTLSRQNNFLPWQIGSRVLRTETAPVVALSLINFLPFNV